MSPAKTTQRYLSGPDPVHFGKLFRYHIRSVLVCYRARPLPVREGIRKRRPLQRRTKFNLSINLLLSGSVVTCVFKISPLDSPLWSSFKIYFRTAVWQSFKIAFNTLHFYFIFLIPPSTPPDIYFSGLLYNCWAYDTI